MGGRIKMAIVKPDGSLKVGITYTGCENNLLFYNAFCQGEYEKAIKKISKVMKKYEKDYVIEDKETCQSISPYSYGLHVIDFKNNVVHSMSNYNYPFELEIGLYLNGLNQQTPNDFFYDEFVDGTADNLLSIVDKNNGKKFTVKDFFGTTKTSKIKNILTNKEDWGNCKGGLSDYPYHRSVWDLNLVLTPTLNPFTVKRYNPEKDLLDFYINLEQSGIKFSLEDNKKWLEFKENKEQINDLEKHFENNISKIKKNKLK